MHRPKLNGPADPFVFPQLEAYQNVIAQDQDNFVAHNNVGAMLIRRKQPNDNVSANFPFLAMGLILLLHRY